jgi:hypothetical protein
MKNIKVTPYPNYHITDECFERDVKGNSMTQEQKSNSSNGKAVTNDPNTMVVEFNDGTKRVMRYGPQIEANGEKYFSVFPNPVHLFLSSAVDAYNRSEEIKQKSFPVCAARAHKKIEDIHMLDIDADETHICYDEYFKMRMNAIVMLSTAVEAFINHSIPNDYPKKARIERFESFEKKLTKHLPRSLQLNGFWDERVELKVSIINLYNLRNDIIHLKTNSEVDFQAYYTIVNSMISHDLEQSIMDVKSLMNNIKQDFVKDKDDNS